MNILIFGENSYIGSKIIESLKRLYSAHFQPYTNKQLNISCISYRKNIDENLTYDEKIMEKSLLKIDFSKYDVVINLVGYTGKNNIDDCIESDNSRSNTFMINAVWPVILKKYIDNHTSLGENPNFKFIHLSSGCIFNGYQNIWDYSSGDDLIKHEDYLKKNCPTWYGLTKLASELCLLDTNRDNLKIIRIRMPYDEYAHPKNYITKLIKYPKLLNLVNSTTYIPLLEHFICGLCFSSIDYVRNNYYSLVFTNDICKPNIFNIVDPQPISASMIIDKLNKSLALKSSNKVIMKSYYDSYYHFIKESGVKDGRSNCILRPSILPEYFSEFLKVGSLYDDYILKNNISGDEE